MTRKTNTPMMNCTARGQLMVMGLLVTAASIAPPSTRLVAAEPRNVSGIYPHLAMFNNESECGTGAVVPWADRLWAVTYAPHAPGGSSDKLYEITPELQQIIRPESVGGTPANRMIHRESGQLFIGPYAIDAERNVRVIPYDQMYGRPTGNARHLTDPANKIYCASMEEGFYEIDVRSLQVTELFTDTHRAGKPANIPGVHGKGFYSGQGRMIYSNNGEKGNEALRNPNITSGALAEWDGNADAWTLVRRNQFTEVTGPGGIGGNERPDRDPVWSIGWDHRSLILQVLDGGKWHGFRLPKGSHSYDGAHGWNTEWPRIREIGEKDLLMTMHGMFWRFPRTFTASDTAGIAPRSAYLKVIGDFCRWNDRIVFGCDDTARSEFLNKRKAKGVIAPPQSQSNLWFVAPSRLDTFGPAVGRGGVWVAENVAAGTRSEPFLVGGFERRGLHLAHEGNQAVRIVIDVDEKGDGRWQKSREISLPAGGYQWTEITGSATWVRLSSPEALTGATAWFHLAKPDRRSPSADATFSEVAGTEERNLTGGLIRARAENKRTLALAAISPGPNGPADIGCYELDAELNLCRTQDAGLHQHTKTHTAIPAGVLEVDDASVLFVDDSGRRWRLPKGDAALDEEKGLGPCRVVREVATERDLFNAHGSFYELPAENAGGFAKIRPVATHNRRIHDFCSYRGLFVMTGVAHDAPADDPHIVRSEDGKAALWVGVIDDIWKFGKPRGKGGPWKNTAVKAGEPSDPYLVTAYDRKTLVLEHDATAPVSIRVEADLTGEGQWVTYRTFEVAPGQPLQHAFPDAWSAYWLRVSSSTDCRATAMLTYE